MPADVSSRLCFVIMPFSATQSATEADWTAIFERVIKPAVEGANLGYECRRSQATRGNLVKGILEDLRAAHVVIADLTDRNANVFYELGVRHTLSHRTILLAQDLDHIPFDLKSYASHVYAWKTAEGRDEFARRVATLLGEVDVTPQRPDNPVSDFLGTQAAPSASSTEERLSRIEQLLQALTAAEPGEGAPRGRTDAVLQRWLADAPNLAALPEKRRMAQLVDYLRHGPGAGHTLRLLQDSTDGLVDGLRKGVLVLNRKSWGQVEKTAIVGIADEHIEVALPSILPAEEFALHAASQGFVEGVQGTLALAGRLLSMGNPPGGGTRFAAGLPQYFGWRLLLLAGAAAVHRDELKAAAAVINDPIEVRLESEEYSYLPLWKSRPLFFPEAFLGYADLGIGHVAKAFRDEHVATVFGDEGAFQEALCSFLAILALRRAAANPGEDRGLYPAFKLIPGAGRAVRRLAGRLANLPAIREGVAAILLEDSGTFVAKWQERAATLNAQSTGIDDWAVRTVLLPETLG